MVTGDVIREIWTRANRCAEANMVGLQTAVMLLPISSMSKSYDRMSETWSPTPAGSATMREQRWRKTDSSGWPVIWWQKMVKSQPARLRWSMTART